MRLSRGDGLIQHGAEFSPRLLPAVRFWAHAGRDVFQDTARTTVAAADADPIGSLSDFTGKGYHGTQGTAGARPVLKTDSNGINGRPIVQLDATDDLLAVPKAVLEGMSACSIFVVARGAANAEHRLFCDYNSGASERQFIFRLDSSNTVTFHYGGTTGNISSTSSTTYDFTTARVYEGLAIAGSNIRLFVDGVEPSYTAQASAVALLATLTSNAAIGAFFSGGTVAGNVDIGEIIICAADIGPSYRAQTRAYLRRKWGTA